MSVERYAPVADPGLPEAGLPEAGLPETGLAEAGLPEAGLPETGLAETGLAETGLPETGLPETGLPEAGLPETGSPEAGPPETDVPWRRLDIRVVWVDAIIFTISLLPSFLAVVLGFGSNRFGQWPAYVATTIGALNSIGDLWRWYKTWYRITDSRVELRTGRLVRKHRWVPRDRIRSVDSTGMLRHRIARLRVVQIASGEAEASFRLDAVSRATAEEIQRELMRGGPATADGEVDGATSDASTHRDTVLARLRPSWFFYNVINVWALLVGVLFLVSWSWILLAFGVDPIDLIAGLVDWKGLGPWRSTGVAAAGLFVLGVVGLAMNFVTTKWNFRLLRTTTENGTALLTRHGLSRLREVFREDRRLRGIYISEPLLWRWLGVAETEVISTGLSGWSSGESASTVLPRTRVGEARRVAAQILTDGARPLDARLRAHPRGALHRRLLWAVLIPAVSAGALAWLATRGIVAGWAPLIAVGAFPVSAALAVVAYRSLGHTVEGPYLVMRCGLWRRATTVLQRRAVIGWTLRRSPVQRMLGTVTVAVATAAGVRYYRSPDMGTDQALGFILEATPDLMAEFLEGGPPERCDDAAGLAR